MNGRYLLDTNIVIALFANDNKVREQLRRDCEIFIPSIVMGELFFGAAKSKKKDDNIQRIEEFAINSAVLSCDLETAREYGMIKERLKLKGKPIPENDLWIAAIAKQKNLILVSRDNHFSEIDDLQIINW